MNYILDPSLSDSSIDPQGNRVQASLVTRRWEKVTARQALNALLKDHNPATSTNRITLKKEMDEKSILRKNAIEK